MVWTHAIFPESIHAPHRECVRGRNRIDLSSISIHKNSDRYCAIAEHQPRHPCVAWANVKKHGMPKEEFVLKPDEIDYADESEDDFDQDL